MRVTRIHNSTKYIGKPLGITGWQTYLGSGRSGAEVGLLNGRAGDNSCERAFERAGTWVNNGVDAVGWKAVAEFYGYDEILNGYDEVPIASGWGGGDGEKRCDKKKMKEIVSNTYQSNTRFPNLGCGISRGEATAEA